MEEKNNERLTAMIGEMSDFYQNFVLVDDDQIGESTIAEEALVKNNYLDLKKQHKMLDAQIKELNEELTKEVNKAFENELTPEVGDRVLKLHQRIASCVEKDEKCLEKLDNIENGIKKDATQKVKNAKEKVSGLFSKAKKGLTDKIVGGIAAMQAMKEKLHEYNENVAEKRDISADTFSTKVAEDIEKIGRNWMSFNFEKDKIISKALDGIANTLEQDYQKQATVKQAFKNLGKTFTGKQQDHGTPEMTEKQASVISKLRNMSGDIKQEMKDLEKEFKLSKEISVINLKSAMELREGSKTNIKQSKGLRGRFEAAKAASIEWNSQKDKSTPQKDKDIAI